MEKREGQPDRESEKRGKPAVSVLMSAYDPDEKQLLAAVDSIIGQTFRDWEMLLYDDGSCEKGRRSIRKAASMDPRIRQVRGKKNQGLGHAMQALLPLAEGRYIARMDADDLSRPERFLRQYTFLSEHPGYQWVGSNAELMDGAGVWGARKMPRVPKKEDFLNYSPYIHPSVMFRREVLEACGGYRPSRKGEDYELFMRLHAEGYQGYNLQENLFCYRENRKKCPHLDYVCQMEEVGIRYRGFRDLGILSVQTLPYVVKPLLVGLVPGETLAAVKQRTRNEMYVAGYRRSQV